MVENKPKEADGRAEMLAIHDALVAESKVLMTEILTRHYAVLNKKKLIQGFDRELSRKGVKTLEDWNKSEGKRIKDLFKESKTE